ncbi:MAG: B12-binding domain-containing radical SAM protein [Candidatus Scalindua rubra]|uniref:Protein involved in methylthiolation of isopentenylated A37 derivatives in tRNA n=1 Tax=Candidatus Scalindua brodae TaxID=237368 RepID=A0A0B0EJT6_9BACT|nr:MAG: protein involved in methylthiolation of isopentenylated A37 derivatives in tRNA [Candidatus Scalindua brodae]MBZ0109938.1 B12-binding domain-containing radical SAM protein [Candidatus Scalindua rubra]TWU35489.1 Radical SAM superfamily protein [Candidatus Brocadiaceae bacterium S225]
MKIVFLQKDSFVKIAIKQLFAVLKQNGYTCELFIETGEKNIIKAALDSNADLFAFSCTSGGEFWVLETVEKLKKCSSTPIIVGGPHTTFFPETIENQDIDFICRGEGEYALLDLLDAMQNNPDRIKTIPNIWSKSPSGEIYKNDVRPFVENLDDLPMPDFDIYCKYKYLIPYNNDMYTVITGRGCPYNCSYCFNSTYKVLYTGKGSYLRKRSPNNVVQEILEAKEKYGVRQVNFIDDAFFSFPSWLREFAEVYKKELRLPFMINSEATQVKEEYVRLIKEMGCICVRMGVETGNEHLRKNILNKKVSNKHIKNAARHIKNYGIKLTTYNILGLPGETLKESLETFTLNKEIRADFIQCSLLQPYPGTKLTKYIQEKGFLEDENDGVAEESFFVTSQIKIENKNEVLNLHRLMQAFLIFHIPFKTVKLLIKLPGNPLFEIIFKISFIFSKIRTQRIRLIPLFRLGLHSRSYMRRSKAKNITKKLISL